MSLQTGEEEETSVRSRLSGDGGGCGSYSHLTLFGSLPEVSDLHRPSCQSICSNDGTRFTFTRFQRFHSTEAWTLTDEAGVHGSVVVIGEGVENAAAFQLVWLMDDPLHRLQDFLITRFVSLWA